MDFRDRKRARNRYVRTRLLADPRAKERGFQAEIEKAAGFTSAHVSNFLHKGLGETGEIGERIAKALWGLDAAQLDALAAAAPPTSVAEPTRSVVVEDRYPSRAPVLAAARTSGVAPAAIAAVEAIALKGDDDPGEEAWFRLLDEWIVKVRRFAASPKPNETLDDADLVEPAPKGLPPRAIVLVQDKTHHGTLKGPGSRVRPTDPDATIRPRDKKKLR